MTCLIYKHKDFIFKLSKLRKHKSKLLELIKKAKNGEIKAIGELSYNILNRGIFCSHYRKRLLKPHTASLRLLGDRKITLKKKKSRILNGGGILLTALIPLAINAISTLVGTHIKKMKNGN